MSKNKHITLSNRITIEQGLNNNSSRKSIADTIGKDNSSVCKEIKTHVKWIPFSRTGVPKKGTYDCIHISECGYNAFCPNACSKRVPVQCKRKDSASGVCNGCEDKSHCKLTKKIYEAQHAHDEYQATLSESRLGWNLSYSEAKDYAEKLSPLLDQGQSVAVALENHPEISVSEKTIYNYIDQGAFSEFGITNMDLRRKVGRKITKKKARDYKPRKDNKYLKGRTYEDFTKYIDTHPNASVVEMDTVYNDGTNGPFIQTFCFRDNSIMKGIYHTTKTAEEMLNGVKYLHDCLGEEEFKKYCEVILTDRGTEFSYAEEIEKLGCHVFYCDPMCSWQKPHVENGHIIFRYVCPKKKNLNELGLNSQEDCDLVFSHMNSYKRQSLSSRSPYEVFQFFNPDSKFLENLNIQEIEPDEVILKPSLLKK